MTLPPIHPALVHFPIALVILSLFCDLVGRVSSNQTLRAAGFWTLVFGAIGGLAAGASGLFDMYRVGMLGEVHKYVDFHMWIGFCVLAAVAILTIWRWVLRNKNLPVTGAYLTTAVFAVLLVCFQGFVGGEIVFSYGVGVAPTGQSTESGKAAQGRLQKIDTFLGGLPDTQEHGQGFPGEPLHIEPSIPTSHDLHENLERKQPNTGPGRTLERQFMPESEDERIIFI